MKLVIVGGSNGIGLTILHQLKKEYDDIVIADVKPFNAKIKNVRYIKINLTFLDFRSLKKEIDNTDCLIISSGFGYVEKFNNISEFETKKIININCVGPILLLKMFYKQLIKKEEKKCLIFSSIAGEVSSPLFSIYGAAKASISKISESLNTELYKSRTKNRITCIVATSFKGSSFNGDKTNIKKLSKIASECIFSMNNHEEKHYINKDLCIDILKRYQNNVQKFGISSYEYKKQNKRKTNIKKVIVGYLSGTFDLFHIGHLNILKKAKSMCDYLIVGVHKNGARKGKETFISLKNRKEIVQSIKYVDEVVDAPSEDSDAWNKYHYDYLFVGSDYKNTDRFMNYHKILKNKAKIVYFPYTRSTSSSSLRNALNNVKYL